MNSKHSPYKQQGLSRYQEDEQNDVDLEFVIKSIQQQQIILKDRINEKEGEFDQAKQEYLTIKNILKSSSKNLSSQQQVDISQQLECKVNQVDQINKNIQKLINQRNEIDYLIQEIETKISKSNHLLQTLYNANDSDQDDTNDMAATNNKINELNQQLEDRYNQKEEIEELLAQSIGQTELFGEEIAKLAKDLDKMKLKTQQRTQYTVSSNESYPPNFLKTMAKLDDEQSLNERFKELSGMMILYESQLNLLTSKAQENETRKQSLSSHKKHAQLVDSKKQRAFVVLKNTINHISMVLNDSHDDSSKKLISSFLSGDDINQNVLESLQEYLQTIKDHLLQNNNSIISSNKPPSVIGVDDLISQKYQLQKIYASLSTNKQEPPKRDTSVSFSQVQSLISKITRKIIKKEKKIMNFNNQREQFLDEFEKEANEFQQKWKELEHNKVKLQQTKDEMQKDIDQEYHKIKIEKNELTRQQISIEQILKKANHDYDSLMQQSQVSKSTVEIGVKTMNDQKNQINDQLFCLKSKMKSEQKKLQDLEENSRLLEEEGDIQKKRIQDQYSLSDTISSENAQLMQNIQEMQEEKMKLEREIQKLTQSLGQYKTELDHINYLSNQEVTKLEHLQQENEQLQEKSKKFDQRCREGENTLMLINQALRQKELELEQYDKILGQAKSEKESLKQLKTEHAKIKKDVASMLNIQSSMAMKDQDEICRKANTIQKNLHETKNSLDQIKSTIQEKQKELLSLENIVTKCQRESEQYKQDQIRQVSDLDLIKKDIKKLALEKAKIQAQLDEHTMDCQAAKQEYTVQSQTLKALQKQIEKKVTELSQVTQKCTYQVEEKYNQSFQAQSELKQIQSECEQKHFEFKQLVTQIEQLLIERESITMVVDQMKDLEDQMQQNSIVNSNAYTELQIKYDQMNKQIQKNQKVEKKLTKNIELLKTQEVAHNQRIIESQEYLNEMKNQYLQTQIRTKELQSQEDTYYVHQALNGSDVQGFGSDRIQYLVQCQNNLEEMEKVLFLYKNELEDVRNQRDKLAQVVYDNDFKMDISEIHEKQDRNQPQIIGDSINDKQVGFIHTSKRITNHSKTNSNSEVQQVLQNIEELNQNIDKMYQDSFQHKHDLD